MQRTKSRKWKKKYMIGLIIVILIVIVLFGVIHSKYFLSVSVYNVVSDKLSASIRIVQLSDLHNSSFGEDNQKLINSVDDQSPDIILLTGDLLNSQNENNYVAINLISKLSKIAPVYCSYGNHEQEYEKKFQKSIYSAYTDAGAKVLDKEFENTIIKGQTLRIGGIGGYCLPEKYGEEANRDECDFIKEFQNTDDYTILMCHMPVCWINNDGLEEWKVNCVFSGHAHGGEVIIPIVGGIYAPDMGLFPGWLQGVYYSKDKTKALVLSRGLGTKEIIPRFNNVPEIVVTNIIPEHATTD